jgi:potassium-dependent mechanosensitive channel
MKKLQFVFFILLFVLSGSQILLGQEPAAKTNKDSIANRIEAINLSDISIKSSELKLRVKQQYNDMITDNSVLLVKEESKRLLYAIDQQLLTPFNPSDVSVSIRDLEQRQIKLQQVRQKIEQQKKYLSEIIHNLDSFKNDLTRETERWKTTREKLTEGELPASIVEKLNQTISFLDSTSTLTSVKSHHVLEYVDKTIEVGVKVDAQFEKNRALIQTKKRNAFKIDHPSFFMMNFKTDFSKEIGGSISHLVQVSLIELEEYLFDNTNSLILSLFIFFGSIYLFFRVRNKVKIKETGFGFFYKDTLFKVISRPVSASIVLCLCLSILIFPDRPPIFREFSFYIIALPLIYLLDILVSRKYRIYIYAFGVLVVLYMFILLIPKPNDLVIYRMFLLLIAAAELTLLTMLLRHYRLNQGLSDPGKRMIYFFIALHLALAVTGLISNIFGRLILTEIVLFAVFLNIFDGLILFITVILLNGLIVTGIDTNKGKKLNIFRVNGELIKNRIIYILNGIAIGYWIILILKNFRVLDSIFTSLKSFVTTKISIGSANFSLDGFLIFFVVIYVSVVISKIIRIVLEEDVLNRVPLSKGLPHTIAMMVRYSLITAGFFLAVNAAGIPIDKFTIILGAMSVGIGFGMQNIFNNLVSGLILLFERPIQIGDTVQVGQLTGNVQSIGIRSSNIRTFEGAEVIVPNGQLVSNEVINWTLSDQQRRIEIKVQVAYNSDPKLVYKLLNEILLNHKDIVQEPASLVFFHEFGESSLDFVLLFWISDYNNGRRTKSDILFEIFRVLKENNIEIPFPQRDIHIRSANRQMPDNAANIGNLSS